MLVMSKTNIHLAKQCLLLSWVASFEDWSNIFGTRSFTLCKNDLDFHDMSDSATVSESISSLSTRNLCVCWVKEPGGCSFTSLIVLTSSTSSDFHSWENHFLSAFHCVNWWVSVRNRSPCSLMLLVPRAQRKMTFMSGFPWAFWCSRM